MENKLKVVWHHRRQLQLTLFILVDLGMHGALQNVIRSMS